MRNIYKNRKIQEKLYVITVLKPTQVHEYQCIQANERIIAKELGK